MSNSNRDKIKIIYKKSIKKQYYKSKSNSKAKAEVNRKNYNEKLKQIEDAVKYCKENNCKGKSALKTGLFPLIKDHKTISQRLNGEVIHGEEKTTQSILTVQEENLLVMFAKNKCRAMQPLSRKSMNWLREEIEEKKKSEEDQKKQRLLKKEDNFEKFIRFKDSCICSQNPCLAQGLKQCPCMQKCAEVSVQ